MDGWFENYTESPTVILEQASFESFVPLFVGAETTPPVYKQKQVSTKFQRTCLTLTAAQAAQAFYRAQTNTSAVLRRGGDAGQYIVEVAQETTTFEKV